MVNDENPKAICTPPPRPNDESAARFPAIVLLLITLVIVNDRTEMPPPSRPLDTLLMTLLPRTVKPLFTDSPPPSPSAELPAIVASWMLKVLPDMPPPFP